ncbi:MaoC family dehydratase [Polymorphospora rubra]|uniref:MaoC family dehydratase n=1 Tax=Polymorphospora rubra TaxID=338584 RepID=A0A810MX98_9ACTN|nr:MaoC family dehydratase [Polymorphospora rubra]BCJ64599.1 MaoC family dehydratase [Polymorphospora rubra]
MDLPVKTYRVTRADLVRYAGASGDFNPIHWNERFANGVGLPGVIAHGMLTMALTGRAVTEWAGRPDTVAEFSVRFARPVPVPDDDEGVDVQVAAVVKGVTEDGLTQLNLTVTSLGEKVLSQAKALVRLPG